LLSSPALQAHAYAFMVLWPSTAILIDMVDVCCRSNTVAGTCDVMGNQLCAPWRKGYREDEHQWTPRKDSHLLR